MMALEFIQQQIKKLGNKINIFCMKYFSNQLSRSSKFIVTVVLGLIVTMSFMGISDGVGFAEEKKEEAPKIEKMGDRTCGVNPGCHFEDWIANLAQGAIAESVKLLKSFIVEPNTIIHNDVIGSYFYYIRNFSWTLMLVFFVYKTIEILAINSQDPEDLKRLIRKVIVTGCLAGALSKGFEWLLEMNNMIVKGLTETDFNFNNFIVNTPLSKIEANTYIALYVILLLFMGILFLILAFQQTIRFGELAAAFLLGPIAVASNLNDEFNYFNSWLRNLYALIFTQSIQIFLVVVMVRMFAQADLTDIKTVFAAAAMMFVIVKMPAVVKEYMYTSGSGRAATGMAVGVGATVGKQVIRKYMSR
ncbi:conjugal transfer protein TrbL family protein [Bacillus cereus]